VAILCGALGTVGGQTVQAAHSKPKATPNSAAYVELLLANQTKGLAADQNAINMLNADVALLNTATNPKQISKLEKKLSKLSFNILIMTTRLQVFAVQVYGYALGLKPANATLVREALANLVATQNLSLQTGFGINPATPTH
jgi:hypothetical protein